MYRKALGIIYRIVSDWDMGNADADWMQDDEIVQLLRSVLDTFLPEISDAIPYSLIAYCVACSCGDAPTARQLLFDTLEENIEQVISYIEAGELIPSGIIQSSMVQVNTRNGARMVHPIACVNEIRGLIENKINFLGGRGNNRLDFAEPWREMFGLEM